MRKVIVTVLMLVAACGLSAAEAVHEIDVAIVGDGPAAYGAGMYVGAARLPGGAAIFGRSHGGALTGATESVNNWPAVSGKNGSAIMDDFAAQVKALGVLFIDDVITSIDFSACPYRLQSSESGVWYAHSIIIATGLSPQRLNVPGETEYWGAGVATCALCEAPLYEGKDVVVIGGGDSAVDKALHLAKYASHVTVYVRKKKMRAQAIMQERLADASDRVDVVLRKEIVEILGDGEKVVGIKLKDLATDVVEEVRTDAVFLAIGYAPNTELFKDAVQLTPAGYISTQDGSVITNLSGVFAAGTVTDLGQRYNQAFIATGFGGQAGIEAVKYIRYQAKRSR
ncbi:MAG: NAD(P)/FAD-dependent oxidoreductase [Candidatus Dependentiae bacterium]|nr:NAD(P)/FAD-dependent oxidoreductase [Candidatus Dependentiae bacterium]